MTLTELAYRLTTTFPKDELFGLASQIKRSAVSVPANIAEGYGRDSRGAYVQQLKIAHGSLREFETHILIAQRVGLADPSRGQELLAKSDQVGKLLWGLIRSIESVR